ncbi:glutamate synthase large subunit [Nannocystis pusilla]|uniref:Glutamate synthase large subunit n=1 Tax=Nannocystis pusilla TaxID=889268 RepID=A0ABS7U6Q3_9BACT|nr:glutamate synthase large subunit [Nannocystis pusilla]MBZ5716076.1 glutamate synthase large subunit [Nannocystis pusilla]
MPVRAEHSACGVGFVAGLTGQPSHAILQSALHALRAVEHRGACGPDGVSSDGAGVMTDIPFGFLGYEPGTIAVATLFLTEEPQRRRRAFAAFEQTFEFFGIEIAGAREVPADVSVLGEAARATMPHIVQVALRRPPRCRTERSFDSLLYVAKQLTRTKLKACGGWLDMFFISLSTRVIVYKALCRGADLDRFYPDLANPRYKSRFGLFHRRFSTNTRSSWDKAQPFRYIAHNGEINTIAGNRSWAYAREAALGLAADELLTHADISDSGSLNEMIEALRSRSSIPHIDDILAILMPPAGSGAEFYEFWGRAIEPWDGPALVAYSDGETVGARLDRNGFRPARWCRTDDAFYLASEAGVFPVDEAAILAKGTLHAGTCATVRLSTGKVHFRDPSQARENAGASFDARLVPLRDAPARQGPAVHEELRAAVQPSALGSLALFGVSEEEIERVLRPMSATGKEPIGSMGNTARPAIFSDAPRSLYDFFYQDFAQVTNPPLDYLREAMVTDLRVVIGTRPNIFAPRELIPPAPALVHDGPVLRLEEMAVLRALTSRRPSPLRTLAAVIDCTFVAARGPEGLGEALQRIAGEVIGHARDGCSVLILSHRAATCERPPVSSLLALRAAVVELNRVGLRLDASVVLEAGDIRSTHEVACAVAFGATALCPYLALELARAGAGEAVPEDPDAAEQRMVAALHAGLLKVMSKMGISVVRSYQSSKLFTALGVGPGLMAAYFKGLASPIGGVELEHLAAQTVALAQRAATLPSGAPLPGTFQYKEKARGDAGERHAMTAARSKLVHELVRGRGDPATTWRAYGEHGAEAEPVSVRHLLDLRPAEVALEIDEVEPESAILARFVAGAMSFGAISAESQRDLFIAMRSIGARCNSGEGGENPYYFVDGTTATTKQIASARFGVTAEYLVSGDEFEIKVAQGAKPGEGGQLMGLKVDEAIARARHATPGVDLISPPPLHDIYSIEDLKQLIHELGQLRPGTPVSVKLVAGTNIGTIAVGVAKAGASIIHVSGGDGGTGAAPLSSMRHAGLPWELGLIEVHKALCEHGLRDRVTLRVDGGLSTAKDIVLGALLGAEEFGFGKLLLVAQGCIMARICEKNRCPTGIATHDPKFKAKYKGSPEHVVELLRRIAGDVRELLAALGVPSLAALIGQRRYLRADARHHALVDQRGIDLRPLLEPVPYEHRRASRGDVALGPLNRRTVEDAAPALADDTPVERQYAIATTDRAVPAALCGELALRSHRRRMRALAARPGQPDHAEYGPPPGTIRLGFTGSAGQGFGAFMVEGVALELRGEGNDSLCKSMSGGRVVIRPSPQARFVAEEQVIVGNCALYGATGGLLLVHGRAGDRFAVRNSGAEAVVEGAGLHACEYMTGGVVVILGPISHNACAGMTGGAVFLPRDQLGQLNDVHVAARELDDGARGVLERLLRAHLDATGSATAGAVLAAWDRVHERFVRVAARVGA